MPTFSRIVTFESRSSRFDDRGDSRKLSRIMNDIQTNGGRILDLNFSFNQAGNLAVAIYLIKYEATSYVDV
jgi:hypothetical protein